jgi:hypothetical protein
LEGFATDEICAAEVDFSYAMQQLKLRSLCDHRTVVHDMNAYQVSSSGYAQLAQIAVQTGLVAGGWVAGIRSLPQVWLSNPMLAWSWCRGQCSSQPPTYDQRLQRARRALAERRDQERLRWFAASGQRRAA